MSHSLDTDEETVAHLLPCNHDLHNACLKPWVERANSCPICRAKFNMVELSRAVGGPVLDSYAVQDKVQEAELDPSMVIEEDELFAVDAWEPCLVCGSGDETHELMYCDGCDRAVHVFCAGYIDSPDVWYCESCLADLETDTGLPGLANASRRVPGTRARLRAPRIPLDNNQDRLWARVWQAVSHHIGMDLDYPHGDDVAGQRMPLRGHTARHWQQRARVASTQGAEAAAERLRNIAAAAAERQPRRRPEPESQEEIMAWNAFDKAREAQGAPASIRRQKRKATASPVSPRESGEGAQQPELKRPRLYRRPMTQQPLPAAESSTAAVQRQDDRSTFLSSLLKDVETAPVSAGSPDTSEQYNGGQWSPRNSSSIRSPPSSGQGTPRGGSPAPQPQTPLSPPLSATHLPTSPAVVVYSPFSPVTGMNIVDEQHQRGRQRQQRLERRTSEESLRRPISPSSPTRGLSYSAKEEIQRMVKLALGPRYRDKEISKDQYTDINRDVSRKMYELVGDASALADQAERERWQGVAEDEVRHAITHLHFGPRDDEEDEE